MDLSPILTPEGGVAVVMLVALGIYVLTGGADFGGGIWDLLARGKRGEDHRRLIEKAMAPVWEVNHIWMILVLVLCFTCFPKAYFAIVTALHIPLTCLLVGIVLRGGAFVLRQYGLGAERERFLWGRVFAGSSFLTPFFLGLIAAALPSGRLGLTDDGVPLAGFVSPWATIYGALCGVTLTALCAHVAAVFLCVEAKNAGGANATDLASDFRLRALASGVILPLAAWGALAVSAEDAPHFYERLTSVEGRAFQAVTALVGLGVFLSLLMRRYTHARFFAGCLVACVTSGLGLALFPYFVYPEFTLASAAAPRATLFGVLGLLVLGAVVLIPSLYALFRVFKGKPQTGT